MKRFFSVALILFSMPVFAQQIRNMSNENLTRYDMHRTASTKTVTVDGEVLDVDYSDGVFVFKANTPGGDRWYIVDTLGNILAKNVALRTHFSDPLPVFSEGVAITYPKNYQIIDKKGAVVKVLSNDYVFVGEKFVDGVVMALRKRPKDLEYLDLCFLGTDGAVKYPALTQKISRYANVVEAKPLRDGRRLFRDYTKERFGFLDASGKIVIQPQFIAARDFSEGLAAVQVETEDGKKWGFVDVNGRFVIDPKFSVEPGDFHDGWTVVTKNSKKKTYCRKDGFILPGDYDFCLDFIGGTSFCSDRSATYQIDAEGKVVNRLVGFRSPYGLKRLWETNPPVIYEGTVLYSADLHPLLSGYGNFKYLGDGLFWFGRLHVDWESGVVRINGERVIEFKVSDF